MHSGYHVRLSLARIVEFTQKQQLAQKFYGRAFDLFTVISNCWAGWSRSIVSFELQFFFNLAFQIEKFYKLPYSGYLPTQCVTAD